MTNHPYILIMAGGVGSRFWPASREHLPKQFLDITGSGKTLIRETVDRFLNFIPADRIYIITHKKYGDLVRQSIPELRYDQVIEEPSRNNTAASIALASLKLHKMDPEATCIVAPADHLITNAIRFEEVLAMAHQHAVDYDSIVTLGIEPSRADTGYGYIEFDKADNNAVRKVKSFREKPDKATAEHYLNLGSFAWNAGIFIWKLNTIISQFKLHAPKVIDVLSGGVTTYNTTDETAFIDEHYPKTEKISVDYAILEKADNVYTIPCDIGWSDLGTWNSLYEYSQKDNNGNVVLSSTVHLENAHQNLILGDKEKLIVISGLEDYIIIDTDDCLLVYPKSKEQEIKTLKDQLQKDGNDRFL